MCRVCLWPFVMNHKYDGHQQELFYSNHGLPCAIWVFLLNLFKWKLQIGTTSIRIWIFISLKTVHNDVIDTSIYYSSFMSVVYDVILHHKWRKLKVYIMNVLIFIQTTNLFVLVAFSFIYLWFNLACVKFCING